MYVVFISSDNIKLYYNFFFFCIIFYFTNSINIQQVTAWDAENDPFQSLNFAYNSLNDVASTCRMDGQTEWWTDHRGMN